MQPTDSGAAQGVVGGTSLVELAAQTRNLSKEDFVAQHAHPYLLVEAPLSPPGPARGFKTLFVSRKTSGAAPREDSGRSVLCPVAKRGLESPNLVTVGRTRAADICFDDPAISKLHAYFSRDPVFGQYCLTDNGSTNGTRVDERELEPKKPVELQGGERITFGDRFRARYLAPRAGVLPPPPVVRCAYRGVSICLASRSDLSNTHDSMQAFENGRGLTMTATSRMIPVVALLCLSAPAAALAQQRMWSERDNAAPLLAQLPDFAALAQQMVPAVVAIQVEQKVATHRSGADPWEYFFRPFGGPPPEYRNRGLGSGFVIRDDGLILTNYHVVENAESIQVTFADLQGYERKVAAKVLGVAPEYDVALIKTETRMKTAVAYLGDSDQIAIGDWVMAIGNPFGLSHSVSVGIISAKERRDVEPSGRRGLYDFLQTDASINPGNSGGPLVNMRGEVIGINSAVNAAGSGIGFAIPVNMVKQMLPELMAKGRFTRSWIGIRIQALTPELAESYGLKRANGALVSEVVAGGPAEAAGLRSEDVILEFDGKPLRTSSDLPLFASMAGVGRKVPLKVWRKGHEQTMQVVLSEFPADEKQLVAPQSPTRNELGMTVADITPALQRQLGLEVSSGVVIKTVEPKSPADLAELRPGDVILGLNKKPMATAREFAAAVRGLDRGDVMRLQLQRGGARLFIAMRKP